MSRRLISVGLLGALVACAALPPIDESAAAKLATPLAWSGAYAPGPGESRASTASLVAWWQRFDDAQLELLVGQAMLANTSVQVARASLRQAQALRDVAAAALWPQLDGSASAQRGTLGGHSSGNKFQLGGDASWQIDLFGARRAGVDTSEALVGASQASLGDEQVQIAAEVALNYILLRTTQVRSVIARENLASQEETLQITLWRQQAGLDTALEAEQARAAVEQNRALLPLLQTSIVQTQHALAVLTGRAPAALPALVEARLAPTVPQAREGLSLNVPAETLRQRADVRAAEFQVAAALAREGQAQALRLPSFAIGGSLGLSAVSVGALGNSSAVLGSLLASVSLPIFDGGALNAQVRVQQAALTQAQHQYRAAVLSALQQVEDALEALRGDRQRLDSLRLAADAASNAALLARQRYGSGLIDFQTVLETQRTLFATQDGVARASADVGSDQVRLFTALGGGWSPTAGTQNR
ncbi:efflux transporter outer membrane subunit [Paucibacter sp. B2R-40]|uniref:efflux transporter outer membrane subunit n=1 Tax=Paucibacter sp. B2R-40 TaxID=2893554 RepID=UPI0021E3660F|nr:efflux transporter outer membrane subunit [Paucibacter sp. B2R-40]MCV2356520.1 efflux transporter outer membrane subunit [Paucibacter sp. B2R-40]